jgi:hypothetical protein
MPHATLLMPHAMLAMLHCYVIIASDAGDAATCHYADAALLPRWLRHAAIAT